MAVQKLTLRQRASRLFWRWTPEKMRLQHTLRTLNRFYNQGIEKAERQGKWDKREELLSEASFETEGIYGRLGELETLYWSRKARRHHVPLPERPNRPNHNWTNVEDRQEGKTYWYLTDAGVFEVRKLLREEQKYRRDGRLAYIGVATQLLAALTGIGGTLIGVLSILQGKGKH